MTEGQDIKRVLVTGGSGFLGRRIVAEAAGQGYEVIAPRSSEFDLETGRGVGELFVRQRKEAAPIDCVIHSAAYYGGIGLCKTDPLGMGVRNARMAATIFEESARNGVRKIVSVGSTCAYPAHTESDMTEEMMFEGRCHQSVDPYGTSKRLHLVMMRAAHQQYGTDCVQLALTNLYGEHDVFQEYRSHAIPSLIKKMSDAKHMTGGKAVLWGTGRPVRQFCYVGDAARAIVAGIRFAHDDEPTNVGGKDISIGDLARIIGGMIGLPESNIEWDAAQPDGVLRKVVDESKLLNLYPEHRHIPFVEGIRKTISWYMENKEDADRRP